MKNLMVVSIKDEKANEFVGDLMLVRNEFEASQIMQAFDKRFGNKREFQIYKLGEFNPDVGLFSNKPELLAKFIDEDEESIKKEVDSIANE